MLVSYTDRYLKHAARLPAKLRVLTGEREKLFRDDPFHSSLRTHKLHGQDRSAWAFWINQKYRVKFVFISPAHILFLDIGTHDRYR